MPATEVNKDAIRPLLEAEALRVSAYTVGFVLPTTAKGLLDARLGGSGTLVAVDDVEGILTADHVIKLLKTSRYTGLVLPTAAKELHNISFETDAGFSLSFGPAGAPDLGPDVGIVVPPPEILSTLKARKSFYNLSMRRERILERPQPVEYGIWMLSGFAGEWTGDGLAEQGFSKVKYFRGMYADGKVTRECNRDDFDYLILEALYNEFYEGPQSFGGFSGGGLWQLLVKPEGDELRVVDRLLSGVAFYESDMKNDDMGQVTREIKCHGRRSVYGPIIHLVRTRQFSSLGR
jgi:hypothetical protein